MRLIYIPGHDKLSGCFSFGSNSDWRNVASEIRVAELFAGVGGFRLGLDGYSDPRHPEFSMPAAGPFHTVWANQWEPGSARRQFAARCYEARFGAGSVVNEDIHTVLDRYEAKELDIPDVHMVVGGFPCQDYSVAKTLSQAAGIEGKKGVLWWDIYRFLRLKQPRFGLFENVDRLLKSPAPQRGRDFAIILSCLASLGYAAEWRVINSAEYGFPQRRKRVYILAEKTSEQWDLNARLEHGIMAQAFPIAPISARSSLELLETPADNSERFGLDGARSPFHNAGVMQGGSVVTADVEPRYDGEQKTIRDVISPSSEIPQEYFIPDSQRSEWEYLKGSKRIERVSKSGHSYTYSEGSMSFPDAIDRPSRTILTGEGGKTPSRFKHVIECPDGRLRRLVPDELERLQGFPKGWTAGTMTDGNRAFCMGNALVTGIPHAIGTILAKSI